MGEMADYINAEWGPDIEPIPQREEKPNMARERETRNTRTRTRRDEDEDEKPQRGRSASAKGSGKSKKIRALSLDPEDNLQFGLVDDIDGTITGAWYAPWNMNGKLERDGVPFHLLGFHVSFDIGEEDDHIESYSAGYLDSYAPSEDGIDPAGGDDNDYLDLNSGDLEEAADDMRGPWKIPVRAEGRTERKAGSKRTGEDFFFESLKKAAKAAGIDIAFKNEDGSPRNAEEILVGISCHLGRLKQREEDKNGILVPVTVFEAGGGKKKGKAAKPTGATGAKTAGKSRARDDEDEDDEEEDEEEEETRSSRSRRSSTKPATRRGHARGDEDGDDDETEDEPEEKPTRRGKTTGKSAKSLPDDADEQVEEAIREMLDEAGGKLKKSLLGDIADKFETQSMAKYALSCIGDPDYLASLDGIAYDAKKQLLTLEEGEEE